MDKQLLISGPDSAVEYHRRLYQEALKVGRPLKTSSLIDSYKRMRPLLHRGVDQATVDPAALKYSLDRLPSCVERVKKVVLARSREEAEEMGLNIYDWEKVTARARRRQMFFDSSFRTLVCLIASVSDIDDLVNLLIAYQIEAIKIKQLITEKEEQFFDQEDWSLLGINESDWRKIKSSFGADWSERLKLIMAEEIDFELALASSSWIGYRQLAQEWWEKVEQHLLLADAERTPIYFVSSNWHSLLNIIGGFVAQRQNEIFYHIETKYPQLNQEWQKIKDNSNVLRVNDFLYYASKLYFHDFPDQLAEKTKFEEALGIRGFTIDSPLRCDVQLIPVAAIAQSTGLDPNLKRFEVSRLRESKAYILNINYPLGFAAYFLLSEILENLRDIRGVYIIGKAAILAGKVGDVQVPKVVFDEHTSNIYFFNNIFNQHFPFDTFQSDILKEQKSISVYGPFLENQAQMENYTSAGFNIIEMESGPYLTALAEVILNDQFPNNQVLHLDKLPFELGIINYASDNPLSKQTLGEGSLALKGIEPTYLALLAVSQRIIELELAGLNSQL